MTLIYVTENGACVGFQTNRPFGVDGESFENPKYLDKLTETMGAEALDKYDPKVTCCGGALAFSEPRKAKRRSRTLSNPTATAPTWLLRLFRCAK